MRRAIAVVALCMLECAAARADAPPNPPAPPAPPMPPAMAAAPTAADIRAAARPPALEVALRAALAESSAAPLEQPKATFGADARMDFGRRFGDAKRPYCLHADGLKRQPTFFLGGYIALPFVLVARALGKCLF